MKLNVAYLDRDGTINVDRHYLDTVDEFDFCDGALQGLTALQDLGLSLVVITNQSGIGRGYFDSSQLKGIHDHMKARLAANGIYLEGIYVCPHRPSDGCSCRKPLPGLIHQAEADLGRRAGVMIGDSLRDIQAGKAAGLHTILIAQRAPNTAPVDQPDEVVPDLIRAAECVAAHNRRYAPLS